MTVLAGRWPDRTDWRSIDEAGREVASHLFVSDQTMDRQSLLCLGVLCAVKLIVSMDRGRLVVRDPACPSDAMADGGTLPQSVIREKEAVVIQGRCMTRYA